MELRNGNHNKRCHHDNDEQLKMKIKQKKKVFESLSYSKELLKWWKNSDILEKFFISENEKELCYVKN